MKCLTLFLLLNLVIGHPPVTASSKLGAFTIKGNIKNNKFGFWDFGISTLFQQEIVSIPLQKNGDFSDQIKLDGPQNLFISIGDGVEFFVLPGDVITLSWDENDALNTFKIEVNNAQRQTEINLVYKTGIKFASRLNQLYKGYKDTTISFDEHFNKTKTLFKEYISEIVTNKKPTLNAEKIIADAYFSFLGIYLEELNTIAKRDKPYELNLNECLPDGDWKKFGYISPDLNHEKLILISDNYRTFVSNKVRGLNPAGYNHKVSKSGQHDTPVKYCMAGVQFISSKPVLDWYLFNGLKDFYSHYDFENAERAYEMFAKEISVKDYRISLAEFHSQIARLKPGNEAPPFTLKDLDGKDVSLNDFRGKLVFIDFWGIYCAPCIYQIKNYTPKLLEKYKNKDIVFLNICVDPKVDEDWKAKVKELNLEGVNLISKGWTNSQVCKDYNISGIPAYVLIDKEGKLINAKMTLPSRLVGNFINQIDRALK